jgi:hypothetical protein
MTWIRLVTGIAVLAGCLQGCAAGVLLDASSPGAGTVRTPAGQALAPQAAMDKITVGRSTKADVLSALGEAIVVPFDSGYEVWVYRWRGADRTARGATELVVLFAPSGVASKVRVRPGYPP